MPAAATATAHMHGQEALDLSIVLLCLKKGIVFIPLVIMVFIFVIRAVLVYPDYDGGKVAHGLNMSITGDLKLHHNTNKTLIVTKNASNANHTTLTSFRDYFLTSSSTDIAMVTT